MYWAVNRILLTFWIAFLFSTSVMASVSEVNVYDYRSTKNVLEFDVLPSQIKDYYIADSSSNASGLSLNALQKVVTWHDKQGDNYLVQLKQTKTENQNLQELVSHLYVSSPKGVKRVWQIYDSVKSCYLDVVADYAEHSPIISDVNNNGVAEVAVAYYKGCRGDVGFDEMKVIMYEGTQKFAARGFSALCDSKTNLPVDNTGYYGGSYSIDEDLLKQSGVSVANRALVRKQLESVWKQTQCSIYFNYSET